MEGLAAAFGLSVADLYRAAYGTPAAAIEQFRSEGVPPRVLRVLENAAGTLEPEQWNLLIAIVEDMTARDNQHSRQRAQRTVRPTEPPEGDEGQSGNGRVSARLRRA
jgi:hypothetical protein